MPLHGVALALGAAFALAACAIVLSGCSPSAEHSKQVAATPPPPKPASEAEKYLMWSMDQYAAMKAYSATETWSMVSTNQGVSEQRKIDYAQPNRFKVETHASKGQYLETVCDGTKLLEVADLPGGGTRSYDAPTAISTANTLLMSHPLYSGSLLYQFFGGSANIDSLMDRDKGAAEFSGDEKAPGGEPARNVRFYGTQGYGHAEALIGKKTGLVYRIRYDNEPERQRLAASDEAKQLKGKIPSLQTTEVFSRIDTHPTFAALAFDTSPPTKMKYQGDTMVEPPSPVPLGKPAPDGEVASLDGSRVRLSQLRGKVVMIDFWATWCGPCRQSLPDTQEIFQQYGNKGLQVLAVSTEDAGTVGAFVRDNGYSFPAFLDAGAELSQLYKIDGIPCTVIIDAKGNLSSYLVGLRPRAQVLAALKKAGLKTS